MDKKSTIAAVILLLLLVIGLIFLQGFIVKLLIEYVFSITLPLKKCIALSMLTGILFKSRNFNTKQ